MGKGRIGLTADREGEVGGEVGRGRGGRVRSWEGGRGREVYWVDGRRGRGGR